MNVAQRGQVTGVTDGFGGPDRFRFQSNYSAVTMSQSTDVPSGQGFAKSLKLDVTTAGGISNADTYTQIDYRFEGQELTRLKYGTSDAETTTISFWIKSPKAGIHWVRLYGDELSGNAFISRKYTVSSANTWQKVILNFPGYTGSGFNNDNTTGMRIGIYFAQGSDYSSGVAQADDGGWLSWTESAAVRTRNTVGQVNCFDSTSNDIYITGVQFEVGPVATPFEHRSLGDELARCQRYCVQYNSNNANRDYILPAKVADGDDAYTAWQTPVATRTTYPTISVSNTSHLCLAYGDGQTNSPVNFSSRDNTATNPYSSINFLNFDLNSSVLTAGDMVFLAFSNNTTGGYIRFEWEL